MSRIESWSRHFSIALLSSAMLIGNGCGGSGDDGSTDAPPQGAVSLVQQAYVYVKDLESRAGGLFWFSSRA